MENQTSHPKPKAPAELSCTELLAGVSIGTIFNLKSTPDEGLLVLPNGPDANGKYSGWLMTADEKFRPILSSKPVFDTPDEATAMMRAVIKAAREIDLMGEPTNR